MARTDTLPHFLTDVADAIRTKAGTSGTIQASTFDTAIANIPGGGSSLNVDKVHTSVASNTSGNVDITFSNVLEEPKMYILSYGYEGMAEARRACGSGNPPITTLQYWDGVSTNACNINLQLSEYGYSNRVMTTSSADNTITKGTYDSVNKTFTVHNVSTFALWSSYNDKYYGLVYFY